MLSLESAANNLAHNIAIGLDRAYVNSAEQVANSLQSTAANSLSKVSTAAIDGGVGLLTGESSALDTFTDTLGQVGARTLGGAAFAITSGIPPELRKALGVKISREGLIPIRKISFPSQRLSDTHYIPRPNIQFKTKALAQEQMFRLYNATVDAIEDSKSANWTETEVPGRFEPIAVYSNSSARTFSIEGALFIDSGSNEEVTSVKRTLNIIRATTYPISVGSAITSPPLWSVTMHEPGQKTSLFIDQVRVNSYSISGTGPLLKNGMHAVYRITMQVTEVVAQVSSNGLFSFVNRDFNSVVQGAGALIPK